ncbi:hypothetical protein BO71DRAFT_477863 [Aspergillus ellipticus CBS 707.79]|uniref:Zn(2)-C6 fungal-type domain-containing protein n=1 Tax=Aspergillus ellipticus CBS 707.79 TaxID=1448320 RepID=A0A319F2S4_9EURO|nr:hypothetical protein BO71DRAFT_477863 [Aspergillus ellipticus CBS 707.79]
MDSTTAKPSRRVPVERRKRTEHSCDRCKSRKQKCLRVPGEDRCRHCQHYDYACTLTKPRKQRLYGSTDLVRSRITMLEGLVKGLVPNADLSTLDSMRGIGQTLGIPLPEMEEDKCPPPCPKLGEGSSSSALVEQNQHQELVQDLQGQGQYIGPASSYFFQMKLRALLGRQPQKRKCQMYLFGRNPTEETLKPSTLDILTDTDIRIIAEPFQQPDIDVNGVQYPPLLESKVIDRLIRTYFDRVNVDFPVLHEGFFLEKFDKWRNHPHKVERPWVCALLCVLILSRRVSSHGTTETQQQRWWTYIEALLPTIIFTSNVHSVQTLMLAALHLHNTNHRDVCWTLTGAAVRIAVAIGLHRDEINCGGSRVAQELRKSLWWTLYGFEQLQVSSHDRPSAIDVTACSTKPPHEGILGIGTSYWPPDYRIWSTQLVHILGLTCRALPTASNGVEFTGPLPPAAGLLQDLSRWHESLPSHLCLDVFHTLPKAFKRPVLLLHIQYHYTVSLLTRYSLLQHLATISQDFSGDPAHEEIELTANICCRSGRKSCELLMKLDETNNFNAVTWLDVYFVYSSTLILMLSIICDQAQHGPESSDNGSLALFHNCAAMVARHTNNKMMPGTMRRWVKTICDLDMLVYERLGPPQQNGRNLYCDPNTANILVEPETTDKNRSFPLVNLGLGVQLSAEHSIGQDVSTTTYDNDDCAGPVLDMPLLDDDNGLFSWDSIGSMLLATEHLDSSLIDCNLGPC